MRKIFVLFILLMSIGFFSCGGGGGGDDDSFNPFSPATTGSISGSLFIPPHDQTEAEPNDSLANARELPVGYVVSGAAGEGDPGYFLPGFAGIVIGDLFRITLSEDVRITLVIAEDDPLANDLDLFLLDSGGYLQDVSEGTASLELVDISSPGTYYVGVRADSGASEYLLSIGSMTSPARQAAAFIPAGADFVPGEILVKWRSEAGEKSADLSVPPGALSRHGLSYVHSLKMGAHKVQVALPLSGQSREMPGKKKIHWPVSGGNESKALTVDRILKLRMDPEVE
ncbi:MAG: PPC domain-containing protein, partial [Proteobacteria bacterium]|nr:PPC domain-containing protein [Pseudomonadota bacterium]